MSQMEGQRSNAPAKMTGYRNGQVEQEGKTGYELEGGEVNLGEELRAGRSVVCGRNGG